jgi:hypothetical protein
MSGYSFAITIQLHARLNAINEPVRVVKNRQAQQCLLTAWFSTLLILASEKDVVQDISGADIIDRFARYSLPLQKQLLLMS